MPTLIRFPKPILTLALVVTVLLGTALLHAPSACAQTTSATLSGEITDQQNRVIPDVEIEVKNVDTGISQTTKTNGDGLYSVQGLIPGHYLMNVRKEQFQTVSVTGITLNVQDNLSRNFVLQVGSSAESITVNGEGLVINTTDGSVGTVVDRQFAENIPLNGRSFQSLIELTPGVVTVPNSGSANNSGQFSVNGQRSSANSFMVDGVSGNFGAAPGTFGGTQTSGNLPGLTTFGTTQSLVSVDALQEFKVQTSTYSAEYGRQPGGQISIVTRSGTNQFHGSAFDYVRNDAFDANNWFADQAGQPKPPEKQNDFGGTLGGPVVIPGLYNGKDKTFFFFSYEGLRLRLPQFTLSNVPTLCLRGMGDCLQGEAPAPGAIQPILKGFPLPLPNATDLGNGLADFSASYSNPATLDATSIRIDHTFNSKLTLFARYNSAPSEIVTRSVGDLSNPESQRLTTQTITLGLTASLTPTASNDLRVNYSANGAHLNETMDNFGGASPLQLSQLIPSEFVQPGAQGAILLLFPGSTATPSIALVQDSLSTQRQFNVVDNFSYSRGPHRFKFGVDYRRLTPLIAFNTYLSTAYFESEQSVLSATADLGMFRATLPSRPVFVNFSSYAQDSWMLSRRLTLDLGIRWDVNPAPLEASGHDQLAVTEVHSLATMQLAPLGTRPWQTTHNNFAPRLGIAYGASQSPGRETVVRGGFGVFYDTGNDLGGLNFNQRFPFSQTVLDSSIAYPFSSSEATPPPIPLQTGVTPPYPTIVAFNPHLKLPYTFQWSLALEQSIGKGQAITVSYVGAAGRSLLQEQQLGIKAINPNFTTIDLVQNSATSDYDALQVQFQRTLARGFQALASYTWSHALDDDSTGETLRVATRGNADFDIRNVFAAAVTYDIPAPGKNALARSLLGHWSVDAGAHAQSALPVDLVSSTTTDPADGSLINVRPDINVGVPFYLSGAACTASDGGVSCPGGRRINPAAFSIPPAGQSGDLGRNQLRGLGAWQIDYAIRRDFRLHEGLNLQFRAEAFNLFNHPNFGAVQTLLTAPNFGEATNMLGTQLGGINPLYQIGGPRSLQFALKLLF